MLPCMRYLLSNVVQQQATMFLQPKHDRPVRWRLSWRSIGRGHTIRAAVGRQKSSFSSSPILKSVVCLCRYRRRLAFSSAFALDDCSWEQASIEDSSPECAIRPATFGPDDPVWIIIVVGRALKWVGVNVASTHSVQPERRVRVKECTTASHRQARQY